MGNENSKNFTKSDFNENSDIRIHNFFYSNNIISVDTTIWIPFEEGINDFLEYQYSNYLKDHSIETIIGNPPEYHIDFEKMIQIDSKNNSKKSILREKSCNIFNLVRFNKFQSNFINDNQRLVYHKYYKDLDAIKDCSGFVHKIFTIFEEMPIEIFYLEKIKIFQDKEISNYEEFIKYLKIEIKNLSKTSIFQNKKYFYGYDSFLDNIKKETFYETILRMYTIEGFLYKELNRVLRNYKYYYEEKNFKNYVKKFIKLLNNDDDELKKISFYYVSLIAAFTYYSEISFQSLIEKDLIKNETNRLNIYRCGLISKEEIKRYEHVKKNNQYHQIFEFISATLNKNQAELYLVNNEEFDKFKVLYIFDIPINQANCYSPVIYLGDFSVFPNEREILIKSGSYLKIEKIEKVDEMYYIYQKVLSFGWIGYCEYLENDFNGFFLEFGYKCDLGNKSVNDMKNLVKGLSKAQYLYEFNLKYTKLGNGNAECIKILSDFIEKNEIISNLNLNSNDLGNGKVENIKILSEALSLNQSIFALHLEDNGLGMGNVENIKNITEIFMKNKKILSVNLMGNILEKYKSENIKLLSDALAINQTIKTLDLNHNGMGKWDSKSMSYFADALANNQNIINLNLTSNFLGVGKQESIKILAEALQKNKSITNLTMNYNKLGNGDIENIRNISEFIKNNQSITFFDLSYNDLGQGKVENFKLLVEALGNNKFIKTINLNGNDLLSGNLNYFKILAEAMKNNDSLTTINIGKNFNLGYYKLDFNFPKQIEIR